MKSYFMEKRCGSTNFHFKKKMHFSTSPPLPMPLIVLSSISDSNPSYLDNDKEMKPSHPKVEKIYPASVASSIPLFKLPGNKTFQNEREEKKKTGRAEGVSISKDGWRVYV